MPHPAEPEHLDPVSVALRLPRLWRWLAERRDEHLARRALALAGEPGLVLDLPCGGGRFWPLLAEKRNRAIIAADPSAELLEAARRAQPADVLARITPLHTAGLAIELPDNAVDSIFALRLLHRLDDAAKRLVVLRECARVSRDSLIVAVPLQGHFPTWRSRRSAALLSAGAAEAEFRQAGFRIQAHLGVLPRAMGRVYVLRKER